MNEKVNDRWQSETDLMDEKTTAELLGITERTLRLWRRTRGVPFLRLSGKVIRFRRCDLAGWLSKSRVATVA